jgi:hypothetical protein
MNPDRNTRMHGSRIYDTGTGKTSSSNTTTLQLPPATQKRQTNDYTFCVDTSLKQTA